MKLKSPFQKTKTSIVLELDSNNLINSPLFEDTESHNQIELYKTLKNEVETYRKLLEEESLIIEGEVLDSNETPSTKLAYRLKTFIRIFDSKNFQNIHKQLHLKKTIAHAIKENMEFAKFFDFLKEKLTSKELKIFLKAFSVNFLIVLIQQTENSQKVKTRNPIDVLLSKEILVVLVKTLVTTINLAPDLKDKLSEGVSFLFGENDHLNTEFYVPKYSESESDGLISGVYVYSYPSYSAHPDNNGNFKIKIGCSVNMERRLKTQARRTEVPEDLIVLRKFPTANDKYFEKRIHELLKERGCHVTNVHGGTEWFDSSIKIVESVARELGLI